MLSSECPRVFKPGYGWGRVLEVIRTQPWQKTEPPFLMFVTWIDAPGVAGGWYDPDESGLVFENAALVAEMFRKVVGG